MYQQASMQCIGDGALYNMFCYRHFCLLYSFFSRRSVIYRKNRFSLIKALLSFAPNFQTAGCALRRKVHFVSSFILRIFIPIYLSSRKKSFFVRCEIQVSVLFLCSPVLCPGLLWSYWKHYAHIFDLTKFLFRFSFSVSLSPWTRFFIWF